MDKDALNAIEDGIVRRARASLVGARAHAQQG
jgi:hypothetical protein